MKEHDQSEDVLNRQTNDVDIKIKSIQWMDERNETEYEYKNEIDN